MAMWFEELDNLRGSARENAADEADVIVYTYGQTWRKPLQLADGPYEDFPMVTKDLVCMQCDYEWRARFPEMVKGLACPRCMFLSGNPVEQHLTHVEWWANYGMPHQPSYTPLEALDIGDECLDDYYAGLEGG
jgi:hypothetical protein